MKKNKNILLLAGLLLILIGIYVGLQSWNKNKEKQEAKKAEEETIYPVEAEEITEICYTDGENTMSFQKEDDTWYYEADKEIPMNQDTIQGIADTVMELTAVRELKTPDALEDYGLTEPQYTLWYTEGGEENALYVGSATEENFYLTVNDSGKVYVENGGLVYAMLFDLAEVVGQDEVPSIGSGNLKQVNVTKNGETVSYTEEEDLAQLAGGFGVLALDTCVDYHVTEEKLAEYGLDEENRIIATATYIVSDSEEEETKTFTVYIGNEIDDENQYVMVEGSKMVYQVSQSVVGNMIEVSEEETE